jgi:hypothetical protein
VRQLLTILYSTALLFNVIVCSLFVSSTLLMIGMCCMLCVASGALTYTKVSGLTSSPVIFPISFAKTAVETRQTLSCTVDI